MALIKHTAQSGILLLLQVPEHALIPEEIHLEVLLTDIIADK